MTRRPALALLALAMLAGSAQAQTAGDAARGAALFKQRCAICHSIVADTGPRPAPSMKGLAHRKAAAVPGFKYSPALTNSGITWDAAKFDQYLTAPTKMVPGTFMVMTVPNARERADVVAYLMTLE